MKKTKFSEYIKSFDFRILFNELGWDNFDNSLPVAIDKDAFLLKGVAEKKGFAILYCPPLPTGKIPLSNIRKQIESRVAKHYFEHLIIYTDKIKNHQIWQLAIKEENKPKQVREISWYSHQDVEGLFQRMKNLLFTLDEEEQITIVDVKQRISENFAKNTDQVTKNFYSEFKKQHTVFLDFIQGIDDHVKHKDNANKQWYASLMLNRLMFCYFVQKKGFLDQNFHYLQDKLKECSEKSGQNSFYSFYRSFLLELFHDGLGKPQTKRKDVLPVELGRIPYLNGGLFDVHELEKQFDQIHIGDEAFKKIFNFFDQWNWHLDNSVEATGRDINPDVIGYIFEKYINDRAAMGAYYTKEDITDYIGKNTILPFLFDETQRNYPAAFKPESELWHVLKRSGDVYIYEAVKKGIPTNSGLFDDLPKNIKAGFRPDLEKQIVTDKGPHLWRLRQEWNQPAPETIALPTEIYRELIERRKRYATIKNKIESGEINKINDLISNNLNIRQFTQDFIENTEDPIFIRHFYKAIRKITILDPTCGSGAFLFAGMNILEPLYEACITRMEQFVAEEPGKYIFFEEILTEVNSEQHPNLQYFIYKSIILNNLYGVDIMNEAVEIAKLRLFLKLVATVDIDQRKDNFGLEPLPDIDFNIRAGNSLVGFATEKELLIAIQKREALFAQEKLEEFKEEFGLVSIAYQRFQDAQLINDQGSDGFKEAKNKLNKRLKALNEKLNKYLASSYGIDVDRNYYEFEKWRNSHQPFHWFAEFFQILSEDEGFNVVVGNPPYIELASVKSYSLIDYETKKAGNLYALVMERCNILSGKASRNGFIVPVSSVSTGRYTPLQKILGTKKVYYSSFDDRPSKLFEGLEHIRLTIHLISGSKKSCDFEATKYNKWYSERRNTLFDLLEYEPTSNSIVESSFPKISKELENSLLIKLKKQKIKLSLAYQKYGTAEIYYSRKFGHFLQVLNFEPEVLDGNMNRRPPSEFKSLKFSSIDEADSTICILNSSLFFWFSTVFSDCRHLNKREIDQFPLNFEILLKSPIIRKIRNLSIDLVKDLKSNSEIRKMKFKHDTLTIQCIIPKHSKFILDEIDTVIAQHYALTEEELDFLINFDIKYRMGKDLYEEME